jgi:hypothetical protein
MNTPQTDKWREEWAGDSQYCDPIVDSAVEIMSRLEELLSDSIREKRVLAAMLETDPIHYFMLREAGDLKLDAEKWRACQRNQ